MIGQVINLWNIHELRDFICLDNQNFRKKSNAHTVSSSKSIFLCTTTWEYFSYCVVKSEINRLTRGIRCQYVPLVSDWINIPL